MLTAHGVLLQIGNFGELKRPMCGLGPQYRAGPRIRLHDDRLHDSETLTSTYPHSLLNTINVQIRPALYVVEKRPGSVDILCKPGGAEYRLS